MSDSMQKLKDLVLQRADILIQLSGKIKSKYCERFALFECGRGLSDNKMWLKMRVYSSDTENLVVVIVWNLNSNSYDLQCSDVFLSYCSS